MKGKDLLMVGALGVGAYLLYKMLGSGASAGGGYYSAGWIPGDATPQTPINADANTPNVTPVQSPTEPTIITQGNVTEVVPIVTPATPIVKPKIVYTSSANETIIIPAPLGTEKMISTSSAAYMNTTYGLPGQPSVNFLVNTIKAGASSRATSAGVAKETAISPIAAIAAGAPPRVVAKIKAGKIF